MLFDYLFVMLTEVNVVIDWLEVLQLDVLHSDLPQY